MPQPTHSDVHVDAILTNISTAYIQEQKNFIATRVFPIVPVNKQSDKYFTYTKADWFRDEAKRLGDAEESAGGGYNLSTDSYLADVFAYHKDIGHLTLANFDEPLDPLRDATEFVTQIILLRQEIQWVDDYFKTGVWGTDKTLTGTAQWSDETGSNPIDDVELGKETILSNTGRMPNKLVLGYQVFRKLKNHPDIVDRIKYTSSNVITEEMLAKLFDVDEVLVAKAIKNTARENAAASFAFTHGKSALLCYSAPRPGLLQPSAGYTMVWTKPSDGLGAPIGIRQWFSEDRNATRVQAESAWDNKVVGTDLGYFFATAVA